MVGVHIELGVGSKTLQVLVDLRIMDLGAEVESNMNRRFVDLKMVIIDVQ